MASRAEKIEVNRGGSCVGVCMRRPQPLRVHGTTTELTYPGGPKVREPSGPHKNDDGFRACPFQSLWHFSPSARDQQFGSLSLRQPVCLSSEFRGCGEQARQRLYAENHLGQMVMALAAAPVPLGAFRLQLRNRSGIGGSDATFSGPFRR